MANGIDPIRRALIKNLVIGTTACAFVGLPKLVWATAPTNQRLLVIILRGAMDGLGAVPALGDPHYHDARGGLAFTDTGFLPLNNFFALNDALAPFHKMYNDRELVILHAAATPYRERSHFDGQDLLENGSIKPHLLKTGWLGRTVDSMKGTVSSLAIGPSIPLLLQGKRTATSWSPNILVPADTDFMDRVKYMYEADPLLSKTVQAMLSEMDTLKSLNQTENLRRQQFTSMMQMAATLMIKENGARIASIDAEGWDTHAAQGLNKGRLGNALKNLSEGVALFKQTMGNYWKQTAVLVLTEFGRTVMMNGTNGSDHGTGTVGFLIGGNVQGGQIIGDWPGLAKKDLYQERDLYPANDVRKLIKAVLKDHLQISDALIEETILPESHETRAFMNLFQK